MSEEKEILQFLFGDRELLIRVADLLSAPVDVIVNPANGHLSHGGGVAGLISEKGGEKIQQESDLFIKEHGVLESGMVAYTTSGNLPFKAVIHAVGPMMGEGDEQRKIEQAVSRSLQLCHMHDWHSVAFPAISSGIFRVPIEVTARGFYRAITSFWDARMESCPDKIMICLTKEKFLPFIEAFREYSMQQGEHHESASKPEQVLEKQEEKKEAGVVHLSEEDIADIESAEFNDWFK